ncbi:MAG: type VI secretion system tube protein Hcp, partial [Puniceicoccales bacterium]|nr:type VI secretion system tube protein Hcp [Puniceicoccales bacterium]
VVAGRSTFEEFECTKSFDASSVYLLKACFCGDVIDEIFMDVFRSEYGKSTLCMSYRFTKCVIKSCEISSDNEELPSEKLTFTYESVSMHYKQIVDPGYSTNRETCAFWWNIHLNDGTRFAPEEHTKPNLPPSTSK